MLLLTIAPHCKPMFSLFGTLRRSENLSGPLRHSVPEKSQGFLESA